MADQTTLNEPDAAQTKQPEGLRSRARHLWHDLLTLAELQVQLAKADAQDGVTKLLRPVILLIGGLMLVIATVPMLLIAVAASFIALGLTPVAAAWLAFLFGAASAALLILLGRGGLHRPPALFERSLRELRNNVTWLKSTFRRRG
jgi:hypothetical protein